MNGRRAARAWRKTIAGLHTWKRKGRRAVHKPLLTLLLIAQARRAGEGRFAYVDLEARLKNLLRDFGPPRKSLHPEYPFWHLQTDGIWVVEEAAAMPLRRAGHSVTRRNLLARDAHAHVPPEMWKALVRNPKLRRELTATLLEEFWPESYHAPIRRALGLQDELLAIRSETTPRDPAFRELVLRAYERACAVCGYDGRLAERTLALDAAHIRWHCYDGPDEIENGLALCSFHHRALDSGALGITQDRRIAVSADVTGGEMVQHWLIRHAGHALRAPQRGLPRPAENHLRWHAREVFHGPARAAG